MSDKEYTPFDFMNSASHQKNDLLESADNPEYVENQYVPYIVNKGFSNFADTILHANEMNRLHEIPNGAQYHYYLDVLRPRKRFKKWNKLESDADIDIIQEYYQCNRTVAKQCMKVISPEMLKTINISMTKGGHK